MERRGAHMLQMAKHGTAGAAAPRQPVAVVTRSPLAATVAHSTLRRRTPARPHRRPPCVAALAHVAVCRAVTGRCKAHRRQAKGIPRLRRTQLQCSQFEQQFQLNAHAV